MGEMEENLERLTLDIPDASIDDLSMRYQRHTVGAPGCFNRLLRRVVWAVMCHHEHHLILHDVSLKDAIASDFCMILCFLKSRVLQMRSRDLFL